MTLATAMEHARASPAEALTREQFDLFYQRTARALRSYICRVAASSSIADDILQESYIRLLSAPPMMYSRLAEAQRKAYLYRTATNLIMDHHRRQARQRRWWQLTARTAEAADSGADLSTDMERLLGQLGQQERALLWLAYVEGASHGEIAEILGLREKSVKVLLFRARRKMEAILQEHGFGLEQGFGKEHGFEGNT